MKEITKAFLKIWKKKIEKKAKAAAISVLVILSLATAMGERPKMPEKSDTLDADYVYLLGAGEPVFRIYSPRRKPERPIAPTIEIIKERSDRYE
jgi:hypothetical protein